MKNKNEKDPLVKRLDALIAIKIEELLLQKEIGIGQIYTALYNAGLTPSEIGQIVGRSGKDVSATIAMHQKGKRGKQIE